jgi:hypothetical protein
MTRKLTIWEEIGLRWCFQEIEGWTQWLYGWNSLRTGSADERCVWIETPDYADFIRLIEHLNYTSRRFVYTALSPEPRPGVKP